LRSSSAVISPDSSAFNKLSISSCDSISTIINTP
jgi:hypothetical protein